MRTASGLAPQSRDPDRAVHTAADWFGESPPSEGLRMYLDVLRARLRLVAIIVAITVGTAALVLAQADKVYEAEADMLVQPIPRNNENLFGLGLVYESGDPTRDAETIAQLITTPAVAQRVRTRLGERRSASELLQVVSAEPVAQSSFVTITAKANDSELASRLANAFAQATLAVRTERLHALLESRIPALQREYDSLQPEDPRRETLGGQLSEFERLRALPDPTLSFETPAVVPRDPVSPRPVLSLAAAFIGALVLGIGAVLGAHLLDTRIEREEDLRRYWIPVVGRIPLERRRTHPGRRGPLRPDQLSPTTLDAFHRLASSLAARTGKGGRTVFVTGAGPSDGKTTTSINLAVALAALSDHVVLIEGDPRRPALAGAFGLTPQHGVTDVLTGRARVADALVETDHLPPRVRVLAQERGAGSAPTPISAEGADTLVRQAKMDSNWLIFDGAALNYAPEALPLAKRAAGILLVVRLRKTRARDLADLAELLTQQGITPDGFIVIGGKPRPVYY